MKQKKIIRCHTAAALPSFGTLPTPITGWQTSSASPMSRHTSGCSGTICVTGESGSPKKLLGKPAPPPPGGRLKGGNHNGKAHDTRPEAAGGKSYGSGPKDHPLTDKRQPFNQRAAAGTLPDRIPGPVPGSRLLRGRFPFAPYAAAAIRNAVYDFWRHEIRGKDLFCPLQEDCWMLCRPCRLPRSRKQCRMQRPWH